MNTVVEKLSRQHNIILWVLCSSVFVVSVAYSFYFGVAPAVDARAYDTIAQNIVSGVGYRESPSVPVALDPAIIRVGPGYELFLAFLYFFFGHNYEIVWVVHALLMAASTLLMFLLSRDIFRERWNVWIGIVTAALIGLSPDLITTQSMLLSETLGLFLAVLFVYLFFRMMERRTQSTLWGAALGCVGAVGIMVRTPILFLFIPVVWFLIREKHWRQIATLICAVVIVFTPWTIRNWRTFHVFMPTHRAGEFNLVTGNHVGANGEQAPYPLYDTWAYESPDGYVAAARRAKSEFKKFVFEHPLSYITLSLTRTSIYASLARPTGFWFHLHGASKAITLALSGVYTLVLFILGGIGIGQIKKLAPESRRRAWYVLGMLVLMPLAIVGIVVETRYRFLSYPFLALFAGVGAHALYTKTAGWKTIVLVCGVLGINTAIDVGVNFARIIAKIHGL